MINVFAVALVLALSGGIIGSLATWAAIGKVQMSAGDWVQTVALVLVAAGWLVSHHQTLAAQRTQLRHQFLWEARRELLSTLYEEHMALNFAVSALGVYTFRRNASQEHRLTMPERLGADVLKKLDATGKCAKALRENEPMFSETAIVREELVAIENDLRKDLRRFFDPNDGRLRTFEEAESLIPRTFDLMGYLDDLRVFVQNKTVAEIMDYEVAYRATRVKPIIKTLRFDADGNLRVPQDERASTVRTEQHSTS